MIIIVVGFAVLYFLAVAAEAVLGAVSQDQPPLVKSWLPFIGHMMQLQRCGVSYYRNLRQHTGLPICTVFLLSQKVYIVNSPRLVSQIHRHQKLIDSNPPFLALVFGRLFAFNPEDVLYLTKDSNTKGSLRHSTRQLEHSFFEGSSTSLNEFFTSIMQAVDYRLEGLATSKPQTISLNHFLQDMLPMATAGAIFGHDNPFSRDPSLVNEFWNFERGLKALTMGIIPSIISRSSWQSRRRLTRAFIDFAKEDYVDLRSKSCQLPKLLQDLAKQHGRSHEYIGRYDFALLTAFVINTVPVTFWAITHIVADPIRLGNIRKELEDFMAQHPPQTSGHAKPLVSTLFEARLLHQNCPIFVSTIDEVLRYVSSSTSTMIVQQDCLIDGRYNLTKGALVQISAAAIHSDPASWGPNASEFNPQRFLKGDNTHVHPSANRTFGGGNTLCPGRHLAQHEVMAIVASILLRFDLSGAPGMEVLPPRDERNMLTVMKPVRDVKLNLIPR